MIGARHFEAGGVAWRAKSDGSPVGVADHEIERTLRALVGEARPEDAFLGEEFGARGVGRRRWIVDAIDGTASFVAGEPEWGTLIALDSGDAVAVGVVTAAACGRRWWAARGGGAWSAGLPMSTDLDLAMDPRAPLVGLPMSPVAPRAHLPMDPAAAPTRLAVNTATDLRDSSIGIWPPPARLNPRGRQLAATLAACARTTLPSLDWSSSLTPTAPVRKPSTGSGTCHGALLVATGRLDAFLLLGAGAWDVAALVPIVEEAGGAYSDLADHRSGDARTALFSARGIHQQILDIAARPTPPSA
ncbi:inositol monophosphatase [Catenulispora acidiphila DSM 44928]|uniref:Inositol monophosphatase n=1 Tax=Catenulispora acidiphila (strain DSM 44928 / JCM 14897 / NBRC 102108 / NRRL B-24433 / ID139908) TaxID=479433 RepID=C7Q6H6_CATAD|nr:inositol monophosphatase family protein [Catenulispora acidiphila]ACU74011.1 inositol monophosphatase [Catenulispora acidiphila DSM 44928]